MGVPKHLAWVGTMPLIHRTIEQIQATFPGQEIILMASNPAYAHAGVNVQRAQEKSVLSGTSLGHAFEFWRGTDSLHILGDVIWENMDCLGDLPKGLTFFGHRGAHVWKRNGEICAIWLPAIDQPKVLKAITQIKRDGLKHDGWEVLRLTKARFIGCSDRTTDLDYPTDYSQWFAAGRI